MGGHLFCLLYMEQDEGTFKLNYTPDLVSFRAPSRMDIDLTGYNFSLAIGHYF